MLQRPHARTAIALAVLITAGASAPAPPPPVAFRVVEFDEIDHVYTTEAVPPPGSFRRDAGLVAEPAPAATRKPNPIFGALSRASTVLNGASGVVSASGELGRALQITDDVSKLVPLATAMGMAGDRRFDALVQTFVLPRVSPTGTVMLQGFLAAQTEYKSHFGPVRSPSTPGTPPAEIAVYAKGALRHYLVGSNGWVRIEDPNTKMALIIKADIGRTYLIDSGSKTVRIMSSSPSAATASGATAGASGTADASDRVETLGTTKLDGIDAVGFRTQSTLHVAGGGTACPDATITSTRLEYFGPWHVAAEAANSSPAAQRPDAGGCDPASAVKHTGSKIPSDALLLYQANTVEKKTSTASDRYTVVIERGNVQERSASDTSAFDVPAGMRQISAGRP